MQLLWEDCGFQMLMSAAEDREIAQMVLDGADITKDSPSKLLKDAQQMARHAKVLSNLPSYGKLPPAAALADRLARIYFTDDVNSLVRELEKNMTKESNAVAYAFLLSLSKDEGREWHFTREQMDFGTVLKEYVDALLATKNEEEAYHTALVTLHQASGGVGELERQI
jgi:hypothetical protein